MAVRRQASSDPAREKRHGELSIVLKKHRSKEQIPQPMNAAGGRESVSSRPRRTLFLETEIIRFGMNGSSVRVKNFRAIRMLHEPRQALEDAITKASGQMGNPNNPKCWLGVSSFYRLASKLSSVPQIDRDWILPSTT